VGKDHWQNGEGVDVLVVEPLEVFPIGPRYDCIDGSGDTCQTSVVDNPRDYAGSGQVTIRDPAGTTTIDPEPYGFELHGGSSWWSKIRDSATKFGGQDHGPGDEFDVHYFAPAILWHGYKNPGRGLR
jgi:hypothetical protein